MTCGFAARISMAPGWSTSMKPVWRERKHADKEMRSGMAVSRVGLTLALSEDVHRDVEEDVVAAAGLRDSENLWQTMPWKSLPMLNHTHNSSFEYNRTHLVSLRFFEYNRIFLYNFVYIRKIQSNK